MIMYWLESEMLQVLQSKFKFKNLFTSKIHIETKLAIQEKLP